MTFISSSTETAACSNLIVAAGVLRHTGTRAETLYACFTFLGGVVPFEIGDNIWGGVLAGYWLQRENSNVFNVSPI